MKYGEDWDSIVQQRFVFIIVLETRQRISSVMLYTSAMVYV